MTNQPTETAKSAPIVCLAEYRAMKRRIQFAKSTTRVLASYGYKTA